MRTYLLLAMTLVVSTNADDEEVRCLPGFVKSVDGQCYHLSESVKRVSFMNWFLFVDNPSVYYDYLIFGSYYLGCNTLGQSP